MVANLDVDPQPEVILAGPQRSTCWKPTAPTRSIARSCGGNAPSVHDFNGDGIDELVLPDCDGTKRVTVYQLQDTTLVPRWSASPVGAFGIGSVAAFDILGRGVADVLYADDQAYALYAGADGRMVDDGLRVGSTVVGTPVIADVDNDGSAELLLPASEVGDPAILNVFGGEPNAWMGARRIWNQHAYHVTNVHEDARIPRGAGDAPKVPRACAATRTARTTTSASPS